MVLGEERTLPAGGDREKDEAGRWQYGMRALRVERALRSAHFTGLLPVWAVAPMMGRRA
jgi:hypothetical protein